MTESQTVNEASVNAPPLVVPTAQHEPAEPPARARLHTIVALTQIVANITVVIGLAIAGATLWTQRQHSAIASTEDLLAQFSEGHMFAAQSLLYDVWTGQDLSIFAAGLPRKAINALVEESIRARSLSIDEVDKAIVLIAQYLDAVEICVATGRCDSDLVEARIGAYAINFQCTYLNRIEQQANRRLLPIGKQLENWVSRKGGCVMAGTAAEVN